MDDVTKVRAGMELLAWEYDPETWQQIIRRRRAYRRTRGDPGEQLDELENNNPGRVVFTSNGILYGGQPWPWRTRWMHLNQIQLIRGGWQALLFTFINRWGISGKQLQVPLPDALADHAIAMAREDLLPRAMGQSQLLVIDGDGPDLDLFDPESDPVAHETGWSPLVHGGHNRRTHDRIHLDDRIELRAAAADVTAGAALVASGLLVPVAIAQPAIGIPLAVVFGSLSSWLLYRGGHRVVFDRAEGFWSGYRKTRSEPIPLAQIHALQLISEIARGNQTYVSWELNLVLEDGDRINVVDHSDFGALLTDAERLAKFLGVPLWRGV